MQFSPNTIGAGNTPPIFLYNVFFFPVTASITGTGVQGNTSTALALLTNPSVFGQAVTIQAKVTSTTPGTPTGTVTFKDCLAHPFCAFFPIATVTLSARHSNLKQSCL